MHPQWSAVGLLLAAVVWHDCGGASVTGLGRVISQDDLLFKISSFPAVFEKALRTDIRTNIWTYGWTDPLIEMR